ncbi:MAG: hypothetical protein JSV21_06060 [Nitrospirota bacterium]|nr:MAG: hypothetical protein JSV21_06060 [Nitrospirota bacterium]
MCVEHSVMCKCGTKNASFNFKDEIMPSELIRGLYCPDCSGNIEFDRSSMISDNGWVIDYDMDIARLYSGKLPHQDGDKISPEILFDRGYATWRGIYPGDHIESVAERNSLIELSKTDPRGYLDAIKNWGNERMERLKEEGWRKAYEGEEISRKAGLLDQV